MTSYSPSAEYQDLFFRIDLLLDIYSLSALWKDYKTQLFWEDVWNAVYHLQNVLQTGKTVFLNISVFIILFRLIWPD